MRVDTSVRAASIVALSIAALALWVPTAAAVPTMAVDCDGDTLGVQDNCGPYGIGEAFTVQVYFTEAPQGGYIGFQTKLNWDRDKLDYFPTLLIPDEFNDWGGPVEVRAPSGVDPEESPPLAHGGATGVFEPFPLTSFEGAVLDLDFVCLAAGVDQITLIPRASDASGSTFFDLAGDRVDPDPDDLLPASVSCAGDLTPPDTFIDSGPVAPVPTNNPEFTFSSSEDPSTFECRVDSVEEVDFTDCDSPHPLPAPPLDDGSHRFEVRAIDATLLADPTPASRTFVVDTEAPDAPTFAATDPPSPANNNLPRVRGAAEAGSTVTLYKTSDCSGTKAGIGSATTFATIGIGISGVGVFNPVSDNSQTSIRATARDTAGNVSACSATFVDYEERSVAPAPPTFAVPGTDPPSPANNNTPRVKGTAEAGTWVEIYATGDCSGNPVAQGSATSFASPGLRLQAAVSDNSTTTFRATAKGDFGTSPCSSTSTSYTEDSTAPPAPILPVTDVEDSSPLATLAARDNTPPDVKINSRAVRVGSNVPVLLSCPASEPDACEGSVALKTSGKVRVSKARVAKRKARRRKVRLGSRSFVIVAGRSAVVRVRLSRSNRRLLRRLHRVRVRATVKVRDRAGNQKITTKVLRLTARR